MANEKRLIELIRKADKEDHESLTQDVHYAFMAYYLIANGVEIPVRCKDCEKWQRHTHVDRERGHCRRFDITKHESGFCDRGERRNDE